MNDWFMSNGCDDRRSVVVLNRGTSSFAVTADTTISRRGFCCNFVCCSNGSRRIIGSAAASRMTGRNMFSTRGGNDM